MATISNRSIYNPKRSATAVNKSVVQTPTSAPSACCCPACSGLECLDRTRFFAGQLLSEADLNNEQAYWMAKSRLHNRYLNGWGVVCGLQVVCGDCDGWVTVQTGYAIDPCGNDVIVCTQQPFNVIQAIQACCTPQKTANCSPPRSAPPANCQDIQQKWCITIQYDEQPTRPVTPLRQSSGQTSGCGCGGQSKGGCSCGGNGQSTSSTPCCCSTVAKQTSAAPGCEPTRIYEGFKLGVCAAPTDSTKISGKNTTNGASTSTSNCIQGLQQLVLQKPSLTNVTDPNTAYTAVCNFTSSIRKYLTATGVTHCQLESTLLNLQIPRPSQDPGYIGQLQNVLDTEITSLTTLLFDCFCKLLLPTCPPSPCSNCLVLACVTVQNGKIIDICHFGGGRRQLVTFPALGYWLSLFGLDKSLTTLTNWLEAHCCGEEDLVRTYQAAFAPEENFSTAGLGNPAMLNRILSASLTQHVGSNIVNAVVPGASAVDLRPLVGGSRAEAFRTLKANQIDAYQVEAGPAWTDDVVAQGQQFAPAVFGAGQAVTVYTKGDLVVGFEPTSPTEALKRQIADLQSQVSALQGQSGPAAENPKQPKKR